MRGVIKSFFWTAIGFVILICGIQLFYNQKGNTPSAKLFPVYMTKAPNNRIAEIPLPDTCPNPKVNPSRQKIIDVAVSQWGAFGYGGRMDSSSSHPEDIPTWLWEAFALNGKVANKLSQNVNAQPSLTERDLQAFNFLAAYWSTVDGQSWPGIVKSRKASKFSNPWSRAWSATFISWVMCKSGISVVDFPRTAAHRDYVRLFARFNKSSVYRIPSLNPTEMKPGDIVCRFRGVHGLDLDHSGWIEALSNAPMHCDIVVANTKKGGGYVGMIGGNLDDAVMFTATKHVEFFDEDGSPTFLWLSLQGSSDHSAKFSSAFRN